ncbi:MAG: hypothetical protein U1F11_15640 [Steroidobacteraceae bacterium]
MSGRPGGDRWATPSNEGSVRSPNARCHHCNSWGTWRTRSAMMPGLPFIVIGEVSISSTSFGSSSMR